MKSFTILLLLVLAALPLCAQTLEDNLSAARKSLKAQDWTEAMLSARAALALDPGNQEAHMLLSDSHAGAGDSDNSLLSAVDAYDAPKRGHRSATAWTKQARKRIETLSPGLDELLKLRSKTAAELMKVRKAADKAKRPSDVEWIEMVAFRVAPTEEEVVSATSRRSEQYWRLRGHGGSKPKLESGFVRMLDDPKNFVLIDEGEGSEKNADQITLCKHPKGYIPMAVLAKDDLRTGDRFTLRYSLKWTPLEQPGGKIPRLYLLFLPKSRPSPQDRGLSITPVSGSAKVSFIFTSESGFMEPLQEEKLDFELVRPDTWVDIEVRWAGKGGLLKLLIDDDVKLTTTPKDYDPENMYVAFGFGNLEKGIIRNPRINARKPK